MPLLPKGSTYTWNEYQGHVIQVSRPILSWLPTQEFSGQDANKVAVEAYNWFLAERQNYIESNEWLIARKLKPVKL
jgi:hypothetical protein